MTTIIAAAICHPANVFRRWRVALPLQSSSAFFLPAASRKMTATSAAMRIRLFSISYFRRIGSRIARKIPAQIITAPVLMRNSFRVLTDCALRSPGIMERMPAASVTPAAVRYLDITYSFLVNGRVIRKFIP